MNVLTAVVFCLMPVRGLNLPLNNPRNQLIRRRRDVTNCRPPDNVQELFRRLNEKINSSTFLRPIDETDNYIISEDSKSLTAGPQACPDKPSSNPEDPLSERSICPWYYNITKLSPGHYPRVIPQAVCKCTNCIDTGSNLNQCERVSTDIRVLKESGCEEGFKTYTALPKIQYVGCTCAMRRTEIGVGLDDVKQYPGQLGSQNEN